GLDFRVEIGGAWNVVLPALTARAVVIAGRNQFFESEVPSLDLGEAVCLVNRHLAEPCEQSRPALRLRADELNPRDWGGRSAPSRADRGRLCQATSSAARRPAVSPASDSWASNFSSKVRSGRALWAVWPVGVRVSLGALLRCDGSVYGSFPYAPRLRPESVLRPLTRVRGPVMLLGP